MNALTIEQYAEFTASPEALWSIIGDPARLADWTQARLGPLDHGSDFEAPGADFEPPANLDDGMPSEWLEGARFVVAERKVWTARVISRGQRVVELTADTDCGQLGIGVRVIGQRAAGATPGPTRVVFVARLVPSGSTLRARVRDLPGIRRRFDRWTRSLRALIDDEH